MRGSTRRSSTHERTAERRTDAALAGRSLWSDAWRKLRKTERPYAQPASLHCMIVLVLIGPLCLRLRLDFTDWANVSSAPVLPRVTCLAPTPRARFVRAYPLWRTHIAAGRCRRTLVSLFIGISYGATAGYLGGRVDNVMMRICRHSVRHAIYVFRYSANGVLRPQHCADLSLRLVRSTGSIWRASSAVRR